MVDEMAFLHYSRMTSRDEETQKQVEQLLSKLEKHVVDDKTPQVVLLDISQARATGAFIKGEYRNAWQHNKHLVELIETNNLTSRYPDRYFSLLNNFLIDSMQLGERDIVIKGLDKLRGLAKNPAFRKLSNLDMNIFRLGYQLELNLCLIDGRFEEAPRLATEVDYLFKVQVIDFDRLRSVSRKYSQNKEPKVEERIPSARILRQPAVV